MSKEPGAQRELLFGDSIHAAEFSNVIPVIDSGEHENYYVMVMPRATTSLKQHPAGIPLEDALAILDDIAAALAEINGEIIHRDLKPANIQATCSRTTAFQPFPPCSLSRSSSSRTAIPRRNIRSSSRQLAPST